MTKQNLPMAPQMILIRNQLNELKMFKISSRQQQKTKHKNQNKTESRNQFWNYKKSNHFYAARENAEMWK